MSKPLEPGRQYLIKYKAGSAGVFTGTFYDDDDGDFIVVVSLWGRDLCELYCGPGFSRADKAFSRFADSYVPPAQMVTDPAAALSAPKWRGATLLATVDQRSGKWSIIAGKGNKFEDTELRFDSENEAREAIRKANATSVS